MSSLEFAYVVVIVIIFLYYTKCKNDMKNHMALMELNKKSDENVSSSTATSASTTSTYANAPVFSPETTVINSEGVVEDNSWSDAIQNLAIEPEVFKSHNRFVKDRSHVSSGASMQSVRDDIQDVNKRVGLRRVNYNVKVGSDARVVPSDDVNDKNTLLNTSGTNLRWN